MELMRGERLSVPLYLLGNLSLRCLERYPICTRNISVLHMEPICSASCISLPSLHIPVIAGRGQKVDFPRVLKVPKKPSLHNIKVHCCALTVHTAFSKPTGRSLPKSKKTLQILNEGSKQEGNGIY